MKKILCILLTLLILFSFSGCGSSSSVNAGQNVPKTVTIGLMPDIDSIPFVIADQKGFFKKYGVNVKIEQFKSAKDRDSALQSGKLDGEITDILAVAFANDGGFNLKITSKSVGDYKFIVGKNSGISSMEELKGKNIAISTNTLIEYSTDKMLEESEVNVKDVSKVSIPEIPARLEMLRNGKIDAAVLPDPLATVALNDGAVLLNNTSKMGINPGVIAFTQESINTKGTEIAAVYKAYNDAVEYLDSEPVSSYIDAVIEKCGFPETVRASLVLPEFSKASMPADKDINDVIQWLINKQLIKKGYTPADLNVDKFIK